MGFRYELGADVAAFMWKDMGLELMTWQCLCGRVWAEANVAVVE